MVDSRAIRTRMRATSERMGCPVEEVMHALMVTSGVWQDAEDFLHMEPNDRCVGAAFDARGTPRRISSPHLCLGYM